MKLGATAYTQGVSSESSPNGGASWSFAVNASARHDDVEITILGFTVVDSLVRITAVCRIDGSPDARLASVPLLDVTRPGRSDLVPVSAHVLPHGRIAWISWLFERPPGVMSQYEARIETVAVDSQLRRIAPIEHAGPWEFRFGLPPEPALARMPATLAD